MTDDPRILWLPDAATVADFGVYVARARRLDGSGAARLVGHHRVLAVYVSVLHGSGGLTVLGLRTVALAAASDLDATVPLGPLADQLDQVDPAPAASAGVALRVPAVPATGAAWAGVSPPRSGWEHLGLVEPQVLHRAAARGIEAVAAGTPAGAGGQAVAQLRALVWGAAIPELAGVPAGVAFAAEALGFLSGDDDPPSVWRRGPWIRLSTTTGHVLARRSLLGP